MSYSSENRDQKKAETRARLLSVARELFIARGFEAVGVRDVASASGHSTGAIFSNWNGKEDLFAEAMGRPHLTDRRGAELLAALEKAAPALADDLLNRWAA